jgi:hypothetical protein
VPHLTVSYRDRTLHTRLAIPVLTSPTHDLQLLTPPAMTQRGTPQSTPTHPAVLRLTRHSKSHRASLDLTSPSLDVPHLTRQSTPELCSPGLAPPHPNQPHPPHQSRPVQTAPGLSYPCITTPAVPHHPNRYAETSSLARLMALTAFVVATVDEMMSMSSTDRSASRRRRIASVRAAANLSGLRRITSSGS